MKLGLDAKGEYVITFYGQNEDLFKVRCTGSLLLHSIREYVQSRDTKATILGDKFATEEDMWVMERRDKSFSDKEGKKLRNSSVLYKKVDGKAVYASVISYEVDEVTKDFISCILITKGEYNKIEITDVEELKTWLKVSISRLNG